MKNFLVVLIFLLIASCFSVRPEPRTDFDHMLNSTAALVSYQPSDQEYHILCAGVFISEVQVLTAAHCVAVERQPRPGRSSYAVRDFVEVVTYADFNLNHAVTTTHIFVVESVDFELDLALLQTVGDIEPGEFEVATISDVSYPGIGSEVFSVGHPLEIAWNVSSGIISRRQSMNGRTQIVHSSTQSYFGSSGGPLFSRDGEVIGIAHAILVNQSWLPLFIGPRSIRGFLQSGIQEN